MSKIQKNMASTPQFRPKETVCFIGGTGVVKDCRSDSGSWTYLVEMEMASHCQIDRVGYETTIWLHEADLSIPEERLVRA
jgi:hypothetical protein